MEYSELSPDVIRICEAFVPRLQYILGDKLYGVYLYGASMFPESGRASDIDSHVILNSTLSEKDRDEIDDLYAEIAERFPSLGGELDIWYILCEDARKPEPPQNRLKPDMFDMSWALHCAHIRAGRYITLFGPEPADIFPEPSWQAIVASLDHEIGYVKKALEYPQYCVLNLCRILYSFHTCNVVVSKRFSGRWASERYPQWARVIEAAVHTYEGTATDTETALLYEKMDEFLWFGLTHIDAERQNG